MNEPDVHGCDGCDEACGFHPEPDATLADLTDEGVRAALVAGENARRRREHPVRLDPELWRPAPQWWPPEDPEYRAYRAANRPFRRAFPGGEFRRRILHAVGVSTAASKEAQS